MGLLESHKTGPGWHFDCSLVTTWAEDPAKPHAWTSDSWTLNLWQFVTKHRKQIQTLFTIFIPKKQDDYHSSLCWEIRHPTLLHGPHKHSILNSCLVWLKQVKSIILIAVQSQGRARVCQGLKRQFHAHILSVKKTESYHQIWQVPNEQIKTKILKKKPPWQYNQKCWKFQMTIRNMLPSSLVYSEIDNHFLIFFIHKHCLARSKCLHYSLLNKRIPFQKTVWGPITCLRSQCVKSEWRLRGGPLSEFSP